MKFCEHVYVFRQNGSIKDNEPHLQNMLSSEKFWKMIPDGTLEAAELPYVKCYNKHSPDNNKVVQVIERIDPIKGNWITEIFYLKL